MNAISAAKMRRNLEFATPYTCLAALREGSTETRVSALVMGFGNMMHKQVAKGLLFRQDRQGGKPAGGTLH